MVRAVVPRTGTGFEYWFSPSGGLPLHVPPFSVTRDKLVRKSSVMGWILCE